MNLLEDWIILSFLKLFLILSPIFLLGKILLKRITADLKLALLIPSGIILGLTIFTFLINLSFNILPGKSGILLSYLILLGLCLVSILSIKWKLPKVNKKIVLFWLLSLGFWLLLISWKANFALIGGDVRSYYAIAGSLIKGNNPQVTPWQPDVDLAYHTGAFELLAALSFLTNISFLPLHLILSVIFIVCSIQILTWIINKEFSVSNFVLANIAALIGFVSFGFLKIIYPILPLNFPQIKSINDLVIWLRNLPQARESIELYGVSYNLDSLIYILFQNFGLAILFCIIVILLYFNKSLLSLVILLLCLSTLALVNESIFVPAIIPIFIGTAISFSRKILSRKFLSVTFAFVITGVIILFQGGLITANLLSKDNTPSSIEILPKNSGIFDYLLNSQKSRFLQIKDDWLPFGWINIGIELQLLLVLILLYLSKPDRKLRSFFLLLLGISLGAILTYNTIIPKYVLSNSNRILSLSYQCLAIAIVVLTFFWFIKFKSKIVKFTLITAFICFILLPTILPPLAWISTTRFGQSKLTPVPLEKTDLEKWLDRNVSAFDRFAVLDVNSPHPSGTAYFMASTGIKTPLFTGGFKTYTVEPGPEYTDIVYSLNPQSLQKLKISKIIIDDKYYQTLDELRKQDLIDQNFFELLFEEKNSDGWKRVYKINDVYFLKGTDLKGTFEDLNLIAPKEGKYYIDSEKNFYINYIRRPLIFTLRDRDLYFEAESGVYQHTEIQVNMKAPLEGVDYDFLVLSDKTDPIKICGCTPKPIWKYLNGKIVFWKVN